MIRKLLAGVLGGIAFFAWSSFVHLGTGLAETGFQEIPNEQAVLGAMKANLPGDFLLSQTNLTSFAARWRFVTVAGVLAAITTNISYWNFYGFPGNYTVAYMCILAMGFVFAGLIVAVMVKPAAGISSSRAAGA